MFILISCCQFFSYCLFIVFLLLCCWSLKAIKWISHAIVWWHCNLCVTPKHLIYTDINKVPSNLHMCVLNQFLSKSSLNLATHIQIIGWSIIFFEAWFKRGMNFEVELKFSIREDGIALTSLLLVLTPDQLKYCKEMTEHSQCLQCYLDNTYNTYFKVHGRVFFQKKYLSFNFFLCFFLCSQCNTIKLVSVHSFFFENETLPVIYIQLQLIQCRIKTILLGLTIWCQPRKTKKIYNKNRIKSNKTGVGDGGWGCSFSSLSEAESSMPAVRNTGRNRVVRLASSQSSM